MCPLNDRGEHPTRREVVNGVPADWSEDGLLWLVNASVFHPRGFALIMKRDGSEPMLIGDGSEPWSYDPNDEPTPAAKRAAVEALFARARTQVRPAHQPPEEG